MAIEVILGYRVVFGTSDASDWYYWRVVLEGKEEEAYRRAERLRIPFNEIPTLNKVEKAVRKAIEEEEWDVIRAEDHLAKLAGEVPVDPDRINDLVAARDLYTLEFFDLKQLSEKELEDWDANHLDFIPCVCDFERDFVPTVPEEKDWKLEIQWRDLSEVKLYPEEAVAALKELFAESNGVYGDVHDYVEDFSDCYYEEESLERLAEIVALVLGITDYTEEY